MALPWALRSFHDGRLTTGWPVDRDHLFEDFPAAVSVDGSVETAGRRAELATSSALDSLCPTGALLTSSGDVRIDRGRCILCGRCVEAFPEVFSWQPGSATAALARRALVVPNAPEDDDALVELRARLAARVRRLRRSVHVRHVDAGSDGSDEWEVQALLNPVYDVHRLGIFFTASPRHADVLLVTGIGTAGMAAPLRRTREAMPDPVVVVAAGTDAASGGLFQESYSAGRGVGPLIDVDVWVPGSPPSPFSLLHGLLLALGRIRPTTPLTAPATDR